MAYSCRTTSASNASRRIRLGGLAGTVNWRTVDLPDPCPRLSGHQQTIPAQRSTCEWNGTSFTSSGVGPANFNAGLKVGTDSNIWCIRSSRSGMVWNAPKPLRGPSQLFGYAGGDPAPPAPLTSGSKLELPVFGIGNNPGVAANSTAAQPLDQTNGALEPLSPAPTCSCSIPTAMPPYLERWSRAFLRTPC